MTIEQDTLISHEQKLALEQMKKRVANEHGEKESEDEYRLLRFLRARDYDVDKASVMLSNHFDWRKKFQIDDIGNYDPPEVCDKYISRSKHFFDKDGDLLQVFCMNTLDIKGLLKSAKKTDLLKTVFSHFQIDVQFLEQMTKKDGKLRERWCYIIDFENYSLAQATYKDGLELCVAFIKHYEANYPERLKRVFVVKASVYFSLLFAVIKPFLSEATVEKIKIFGKDGWKEELLKYVDADQIPSFLGGKITDPDGNPDCLTMVNHGGIVPESYYASTARRRLAGEPGVKTFSIPPRSTITIDVDVTSPGTCIEWEFETANHNIGFGLHYKRDRSVKQSTELIQIQRIDTHMFSETGVYRCTDSGIYILVFDNAFSWIRPKELSCRVIVVPQNGSRICVTRGACKDEEVVEKPISQ